MGLVRSLVSGFRNYGATRPRDPQSLISWIPGRSALAGIQLSYDDALALSTVWACVNAITVAVATRKWNVYRPDGPGRRMLLPDDRVGYLLNTRPNSDMTAIAFREAMLLNAITHGNAYAEIVMDQANRVAELWPIESTRVQPYRDLETWQLKYAVNQADGGPRAILEQRQMFHLKGPGLTGLMGEHIVSRAAGTLALAAAAERFASTYYGNNTVVGAIIEYPAKLDKPARERVYEELDERHKGPERANKPLILSNGAKFTQLTSDAEKAQVVESRKFAVEEICRWFNVPPHKVHHLERMTFNNVEELGIDFVRSACEPWAIRLSQEADYKLFPQDRGPWRQTEINLAPLTYGNAQSRAAAEAIWRANGIKNANEIRDEHGMNAIPGPAGDAYLVQGAMITVEKAIAAPAPGTEKPAAPAMPAKKEAPPAADIARAAVALDRFARRMTARRTDLEKNAPDKVEANLTEERKRCEPALLDECRKAGLDDEAAREAAQSVLDGEPAFLAAERACAVALRGAKGET